jgi:Ulp1 family protease
LRGSIKPRDTLHQDHFHSSPRSQQQDDIAQSKLRTSPSHDDFEEDENGWARHIPDPKSKVTKKYAGAHRKPRASLSSSLLSQSKASLNEFQAVEQLVSPNKRGPSRALLSQQPGHSNSPFIHSPSPPKSNLHHMMPSRDNLMHQRNNIEQALEPPYTGSKAVPIPVDHEPEYPADKNWDDKSDDSLDELQVESSRGVGLNNANRRRKDLQINHISRKPMMLKGAASASFLSGNPLTVAEFRSSEAWIDDVHREDIAIRWDTTRQVLRIRSHVRGKTSAEISIDPGEIIIFRHSPECEDIYLTTSDSVDSSKRAMYYLRFIEETRLGKAFIDGLLHIAPNLRKTVSHIDTSGISEKHPDHPHGAIKELYDRKQQAIAKSKKIIDEEIGLISNRAKATSKVKNTGTKSIYFFPTNEDTEDGLVAKVQKRFPTNLFSAGKDMTLEQSNKEDRIQADSKSEANRRLKKEGQSRSTLSNISRSLRSQGGSAFTESENQSTVKVDIGPEWEHPVHFQYGREKLSVPWQDLNRLNEGEFLNDNLVSFWLNWTAHCYQMLESKRIYLFNSFFYDTIVSNVRPGEKINYESVKRWTKNVDLFTYDYVVIPINENYHWFLAIICNLPNLTRILEDSSTEVAQNADTSTNNVSKQSFGLVRIDSADKEIGAEDELNRAPASSSVQTRKARTPESEPGERGGAAKESLTPLQKQSATGLLPAMRNPFTPTSAHKKPTSGGKKFDPNQPMVVMFDSMSTTHAKSISLLKEYVAMEASDKRGQDARGLQGMNARGIPQQDNIWDCGVYLLGYFDQFMKDPQEFISKVARRELDPEADWPDFNPAQMRNQIRKTLMNLHEQQRQGEIERKRPKKAGKQAHNENQDQSNPRQESSVTSRGVSKAGVMDQYLIQGNAAVTLKSPVGKNYNNTLADPSAVQLKQQATTETLPSSESNHPSFAVEIPETPPETQSIFGLEEQSWSFPKAPEIIKGPVTSATAPQGIQDLRTHNESDGLRRVGLDNAKISQDPSEIPDQKPIIPNAGVTDILVEQPDNRIPTLVDTQDIVPDSQPSVSMIVSEEMHDAQDNADQPVSEHKKRRYDSDHVIAQDQYGDKRALTKGDLSIESGKQYTPAHLRMPTQKGLLLTSPIDISSDEDDRRSSVAFKHREMIGSKRPPQTLGSKKRSSAETPDPPSSPTKRSKHDDYRYVPRRQPFREHDYDPQGQTISSAAHFSSSHMREATSSSPVVVPDDEDGMEEILSITTKSDHKPFKKKSRPG